METHNFPHLHYTDVRFGGHVTSSKRENVMIGRKRQNIFRSHLRGKCNNHSAQQTTSKRRSKWKHLHIDAASIAILLFAPQSLPALAAFRPFQHSLGTMIIESATGARSSCRARWEFYFSFFFRDEDLRDGQEQRVQT